MLQLSGDGEYADVMERALYNGVVSGVSLDGRRFFYENPLASRGGHHRQEWFDCACCPPNVARLIASVGGYCYSLGDDGLWVHLFAQGEGRFEINGREIVMRQITDYPWAGRVTIKLTLSSPLSFALRLRLPGWCEEWRLSLNGQSVQGSGNGSVQVMLERGYLRLRREWRADDEVELSLAMPVRFVHANPNLRQALGRVALQRGPLVYCLEGVDHGDAALDRIVLPPAPRAHWHVEHRAELLGGATVLRGAGSLTGDTDWGETLYRFRTPSAQPIEVTAVPYCLWDNRLPGEMRVWLRHAAAA